MPASGEAERWLQWLGASVPSVWMRESSWLYPAVETLHILGFTVPVAPSFA